MEWKSFASCSNDIEVGEDIGLEVYPDVDQFLRIEQVRKLQNGKHSA